jgi:hypothetical protein
MKIKYAVLEKPNKDESLKSFFNEKVRTLPGFEHTKCYVLPRGLTPHTFEEALEKSQSLRFKKRCRREAYAYLLDIGSFFFYCIDFEALKKED